jgi:hypothetical protein
MRRAIAPGFAALFLVFAASSAAVPAARASCGAEGSCPLENPAAHFGSRLVFEASALYIDQNQPMVGSNDAVVGAIPGHHDEVRTVNRVTQFRALFRTAPGWTFAATIPYVSRTHEHIHHHMGEDHYERWRDDGVGDLEANAQRVFASADGPSLRVGLGIAAPTGKQTPAVNEDGDPIEASARIGTGAWGMTASLGLDWNGHAPGRNAEARMPLRITLAGRWNGTGVEGYRHGAEAQLHVGTEYPLARHVALMGQANYRLRAKDDVGADDEEEAANTGGATVYLTPGLRYDGLRGFSVYGLAQFPVWERVNGIQVVANSNLVLGVSRSIF